MNVIFLMCATVLIFFLYSPPVVSQEKVSTEDLKTQAGATLETAKKYAEQQKNEYQQKIESELSELGNKINALRERAKSAKGETLTQLQARMADLRERQKAAESKLGELRSATVKVWSEMKEGLDSAVMDLKKSYESAVNFFK